jgi:hypothetical protein
MMGAPGMRSAVLPAVSYLNVARVRFLVRLWVWGRNRAEAQFSADGGKLVSIPSREPFHGS